MQAVVYFLALLAPALSSKILYVAPINASSHHRWNTFLVTELAKRGHHLTYIAAQPLTEKPHPNVAVSYFEPIPGSWETFAEDSFFGPPARTLRTLESATMNDCEHMFNKGPYHELIHPSNKDTYDLIMMEYTGHDCLLALTYRFAGAPMIVANPLTYRPNPHWLHRLMGVPLFHLAPHSAHPMEPPFGFWKRLDALKVYLLNDFDYYTRIRPSMERAIKKYFGEDVPSLKELTENVALAIVNIPNWMSKIPLPANVFGIGGIHLKDAKPLSPKLEEFVNGAENGIILISFGTAVPTKDMSTTIFQEMASAVGKLPQRILWKWDAQINDENITFPENVLRLPWLPQNDLLGHPKMRLFVSHCGGQSSLETAYHGVPVLAIPGFWDQLENANRIISEGAGIRMRFNEITEKSFLETVTELLNNPKYFEAAQRLKAIMRNQPIKPLDHAIFLIELVIKNRGAHHLRPLLWDLPHPYTLLADIVIVVIVAVIVLVLLFLILLRCLRSMKGMFACWKCSKNKTE